MTMLPKIFPNQSLDSIAHNCLSHLSADRDSNPVLFLVIDLADYNERGSVNLLALSR